MSDEFPSPFANSAAGANTINTPNESDVQIVHVTYALFALGLFTGIFAIIGVIVAYVKRDDTANNYLTAHYDWLIRTFWWSLLWYSILLVLIVLTIGIFALVAWIPCGIVWLWGIYRVVKGWLRLSEKRAVA